MRRERNLIELSSDEEEDEVVEMKKSNDNKKMKEDEKKKKVVVALDESDDEKEEQHDQQNKENNNINLLSTLHLRQGVLSAKAPTDKAFLILSRCPRHLLIADRQKGFETLLQHRPEKRGVVKMFDKLVESPRYFKTYLRDYTFSGLSHLADKDLPSESLKELLDFANENIQHWLPDSLLHRHKNIRPIKFNSALINFYLDGGDSIALHADDERELVPASPIFSLSLGQTRTFRIRSQADLKIKRDIDVRNLDILVMGGLFQKMFKHEVPKNGSPAPRINITFRCFEE